MLVCPGCPTSNYSKAGNASLLGWAVGVVCARTFHIPKPPSFVSSPNSGRNDAFTALIPWQPPLSRGGGCSLSSAQGGTPRQPPRCSSRFSCVDGGISCSFPDLTKRKDSLLLRPQKGPRQSQGKQVPTSQLSCVRWDTELNPSLP